MNHITRKGITLTIATLGLLAVAPLSAVAAGPQQLPDSACNDSTASASAYAPNRTAAEAIPHVEHGYPIPVPYCHHFNPTAAPPTGL